MYYCKALRCSPKIFTAIEGFLRNFNCHELEILTNWVYVWSVVSCGVNDGLGAVCNHDEVTLYIAKRVHSIVVRMLGPPVGLIDLIDCIHGLTRDHQIVIAQNQQTYKRRNNIWRLLQKWEPWEHCLI